MEVTFVDCFNLFPGVGHPLAPSGIEFGQPPLQRTEAFGTVRMLCVGRDIELPSLLMNFILEWEQASSRRGVFRRRGCIIIEDIELKGCRVCRCPRMPFTCHT